MGILQPCARCLVAMAGLCVLSMGCAFAPRGELTAAQTQNRMLAEQSQAQQAEIENLQTHNHKLEDKLIQSEEQLAALDQQSQADRKRLAALQTEVSDGNGNRLPPGLSTQLANLSRRYPSLQYDTATGAAKLDSDVLFDPGEAALKDDAQQMLGEFAHILRSPEARDLKLMVVGHTDALKIARHEVREKYADNFHLSAARALAVADYLKQAGVPAQRIGVSGFGDHEPIASNATAEDRRRNRRVEIFVLPPEAPIVGWTETTTSLY
ncbi:MAG TPA: OmpA family protein [Pirellulales bacterium]|nr:OmpA family protein [Pirellulales bacterium]